MSGFGGLRKKLDEAMTYGRFEVARELAIEGIELAGQRELLGELEYFKGQIEIIDGNFTKAIKHFENAISYNPGDGAAFNDLALCLVELNQIEKAFYNFDKGIEAESGYATVYHNKGWLLNKTGRYAEAIEYFKQALELDPERPVTYENLADALFNLFDYNGALKAYQKAIELLKPEYSDIKEEITKQMKNLDRLKRGQLGA